MHQDRQPLCETLGYYRSYQGAVYTHDKVCWGILIDFASGEGQYMNEEIIVTKAPGFCSMTENDENMRTRQQVKSQTYSSAHIATFENTMHEQLAVGVIFGKLIPDVSGHESY